MKLFFTFLLYVVIFFFGYVGVKDFCQKKTFGFSVQGILTSDPSFLERGSSCPSDEGLLVIQKALHQPYHFMKRGLQCYVFASQDDQYVLKFFRWKQITPPFWTSFFPRAWTEKTCQEKEKQRIHDFSSYQLAFSELAEETGALYLHLKQTDFLQTPITLYDPLHIRHLLPSDDVAFILQKKSDLFLPYFEKNKHNPNRLEYFFTQFLHILERRWEKGICDSDISLEYNMGVLEDNPVLFDIGNLTKDLTISKREFLLRESQLVMRWLRENQPDLALFLQEQIDLSSIQDPSL